jgi:hypothetical protein
VAESFTRAPRAHQLAHQPPLRAAGVLEFIDQHVLVARLEAVAAAREFVHLAEQLQGALEQVREVEHAVLVQRAAIFVLRDRKQPARAAGEDQVDVTLERLDRRLHVRAETRHDHLVPLVIRR